MSTNMRNIGKILSCGYSPKHLDHAKRHATDPAKIHKAEKLKKQQKQQTIPQEMILQKKL